MGDNRTMDLRLPGSPRTKTAPSNIFQPYKKSAISMGLLPLFTPAWHLKMDLALELLGFMLMFHCCHGYTLELTMMYSFFRFTLICFTNFGQKVGIEPLVPTVGIYACDIAGALLFLFGWAFLA